MIGPIVFAVARIVIPEVREGRGLGLIKGFIEHQLSGRFSCDLASGILVVSMRFPLLEQTYQTRLGSSRIDEPKLSE